MRRALRHARPRPRSGAGQTHRHGSAPGAPRAEPRRAVRAHCHSSWHRCQLRARTGEIVLGDDRLSVAELRLQECTIGIDGQLRRAAALLECLLVLLVAPRAEESAQQRLAIVVSREQELGEAVLGEQDHLQELVAIEPEDLVEHDRRPRGAWPRDRATRPSTSCSSADRRLLRGHAVAPSLGPLVLG